MNGSFLCLPLVRDREEILNLIFSFMMEPLHYVLLQQLLTSLRDGAFRLVLGDIVHVVGDVDADASHIDPIQRL